jgi:proteic killer suppression protein
MIQNFRHKGLRRLFEKNDPSKLPPQDIERIENILLLLNRAETPEDMDLPGLRLHPLKGERKGQWAITVRANWRITFRFEDGAVYDVDFVDYH